MTDKEKPRVVSWFKDQANMLEIKVMIGKKIHIYSVSNSPKMQSVERQYMAGRFGFRQLNVIKDLGRRIETIIID